MSALKKIVFVFGLLLLGICFRSAAQQTIVYSQYIYNGLLINPAYAGSHVQLSATVSYRNQWVNFEGAPQTATLGVHSTVNNSKVGVGLLVTSDKVGSYTNTGVYAAYAYRIQDQRGGVFSMGLQGGFHNFRADFSELNLKAGQDPTFNGTLSELKPNFGGGVFYSNKKFFGGFSVPVILKHAKFFNGGLQQLALARHYYLLVGSILPLDRLDKVKLNSSLLIRAQEGTPLNADINVALIFHNLISTGVSYRTGESFTTLLHFKLSEKFNFGYSYDWITSDIRKFSNGTHEFMLNYRVRIRGIHKDVYCPQPFTR
ncbi:type IX secretion system membrane protein PorP/SprF [Chryseolinea sp. H1M3-3]|uniref:PorP/SprF family type IX secretion system membrane protein n=1 Tax=Chryseolinea sp. H1M3-3 TaxID=3034144 RepID=UPI0023EE1593|nr:type IX secretion system membrane protein PorP/SprF [Chryseolinea sp. H1M3-3]